MNQFNLSPTNAPEVKSLGVQTPEEFGKLSGGSTNLTQASHGIMDQGMFGAFKNKLMTGSQVDVVNTDPTVPKDYNKIQPLLSTSKTSADGTPIKYTVKDPAQYSDALSAAYKFAPTLQKGILESILNAESDMGLNKSNEKNDVGKFGYLVGFTKSAADELKRLGISYNTDTPRGALIAAAQYLQSRMKSNPKVTNPVDIYSKLYRGVNDAEVNRKFDYYHQNYSK